MIPLFSLVIVIIFSIMVFGELLQVSADSLIIPSWIKDEAKALEKNGLVEKDVERILLNLHKEELLEENSKLRGNSNLYQIPNKGDFSFLKIHGSTGEYGSGGAVTHLIIQPDKSVIRISSFVLETGVFVMTVPITFDSQIGQYRVFSNFQEKVLEPFTFILTKDLDSRQNIPYWVEVNTKWWLDEKFSDEEYVLMIQYLIDGGIIDFSKIIQDVLSKTKSKIGASNLNVDVEGSKMVRRGTTQSLTVEVSDGFSMPVKGAKIFLTVEDYGEDIIFEYDGITSSEGKYLFSWEIPKSFNDIETLIAFIDVTDGFYSLTKKFVFNVYCLPGEKNCKVEWN